MLPALIIFIICLTILVGFRLYLRYNYGSSRGFQGGFPSAKSKDVEQKLQYIMAENEDLKDRLKRIEYLLSQPEEERQKIELDKQKEKIKLNKKL
ncbi:MAG: hypothetical protein GY810_03110 [Aureispira sp.]|nr:hypothetical protein [Aureispira sp.]